MILSNNDIFKETPISLESTNFVPIPTPLTLIALYGDKMAAILTTIAIFQSPLFVCGFIAGWFLNRELNKVLKSFFKETRPNDSKWKVNEDETPEKWGFPSGHAQTVFYSFVFLLLKCPRKTPFLILSAAILILTLIQRYMYYYHTAPQLLGGGVIGASVAAGVYAILFHLQKIKG
jgi:membrane-associated phospholipid phosphatase